MDAVALETRRDALLLAMGEIRRMRRGSVSRQMLKVKHKGKKKPVERGPYFLWQYYEQGQPVRRRLTSREEVAQAQQEVENYKRFKALCEEFVKVTEQLGTLEGEESAEIEAVKKGLKSRSNRTGKSSE